MDIYGIMLQEKERLDGQIDSLKKSLEGATELNFVCERSEGTYKWYEQKVKNKIKTRKYIKKNQREYAEKLALKSYQEAMLSYAVNESAAIKKYLKAHKSSRTVNYILNHPGYRELIRSKVELPPEENISWGSEEFTSNPYHRERLIVKTSQGHMVRSKSEAIIGSALESYQLPYRYECALQIGNKNYFPDFTIKDPKTGEIIIWEHFGMMDDPEYSSNAKNKISMYLDSGYYPLKNIIFTYETKEMPLDAKMVNELIMMRFIW